MKKTTLLLCAVAYTMIAIAVNPTLDYASKNINQDHEFDNFGIGFGIGFGFFYPGDVNDWIEREYSNYTQEFGSFDIIMNENISLVATFRPINMLRINISAEAGIGPKLVTTDDAGTNFHNFGRYSGGVEAYLNVPFGSGRNSMLFGVGSFFHHMYFEDYSGNTIGVRVIPFGMSFQFGDFQPQILLGGDLLSSVTDTRGGNNFELNYNHGFIHINLLF